MLELTRGAANDVHVVLTLPAAPECRAVTSIAVRFDKHAQTLAVKQAALATGCGLEIADYAGMLQALRDADTMTVHPAAGPDIAFYVAGLAWD